MGIEGAEINIYRDDGEMLSLDLSATQLQVIIKALGLRFQPDSYTYFADNSLEEIILPRLNLKEA